MNKMHREGFNIKVSLHAGLKNLVSRGVSEQASTSALPAAEGARRRGSVRSAFREFDRRFWGVVKPALKPVVARVKRALKRDLRRDAQPPPIGSARELTLLKDELLREIQTGNRALRRDLEALAPRLDHIEQYACATARRVAIPCEAGEMLIKTEVGFVVCPSNNHSLLAGLVDTGDLEIGTRLLIQKFLKPGNTFVDVGANIGMHALAAALAMQGRGKVFAFEPFEPTRKMLEKSALMNGFSHIIEVHQVAVSNTSGWRSLNLGVSSGYHSLYPLELPAGYDKLCVEVPLARLDQIIPVGHRVDLLKIDVEGAELEVLAGGQAFIRANPDMGLIVEFSPSHLRRAGHSVDQWLEQFSQLGLSYRFIGALTGDLGDQSVDELTDEQSVNLFFAKPDSSAWSRLSA